MTESQDDNDYLDDFYDDNDYLDDFYDDDDVVENNDGDDYNCNHDSKIMSRAAADDSNGL